MSRGERREADRVAGAVGRSLALVVAILVLVGVFATPLLIALIAPGFAGDKRELTIALVRILFPGAGLLVLSAWCLGVLNSHRRFLLSYTAPVMWNAAMIATLVAYRRRHTAPPPRGAARVGIGRRQRPAVCRAAAGGRARRARRCAWPSMWRRSTCARSSATSLPVFVSRGVVQVSAYIDSLLASLLPTGAVTGLANAQLLYTLPVSLFGMSMSAAELPAMAGERAADRIGTDAVRTRLDAGLRQIAFFVVPSARGVPRARRRDRRGAASDGTFPARRRALRLGHSGGIGRRTACLDARAAVLVDLLRAARHADAARYAIVRVALTTVLGYLFAIPLPRWLGVPALWGAAGLTASAGIAGWVEMLLLRRTLNRADRPHRAAVRLRRETLDRGGLSCWRRVGGEGRESAAAPGLHCDRGAHSLWRGVSGGRLRPWSSRSVECREADPAQTMSG